MLSVAKLALGQEAYYEQQVALGLDDYYAGRGESPGLWAGSGAAGLDLSGVVADGDLGTLLRGVSPANGERLRAPTRERTITVRTLDETTGLWHDEPKRLAPVAGYDLVFSCPKSVSLLHALTDDEVVRLAISAAHERSWHAALSYLEAEACVVRRGRGGAIREHGKGFVAAAFRHRTSRAQDPHLHTHVIVANLARSADRRWRALDGEAILRTYRLAAGYLYEASLRHELSRDLGVRWSEPVKGMAEIEGAPADALRAFSTRRQSLVEHMEAMGTSGFAALRVAALATRVRKQAIDLPDLRRSWLARAAEMGLGAQELRGILGRQPAAREAALVEVEELTAHQATITTPELVRAVAGSARQGTPASQLLAAVVEIARRPELTRVGDEEAPGRPPPYTTARLLTLEREALRIALDGQGAGAPCADAAMVAGALADAPHALSAEQRALVEAAALAPDRVLCVIGAAGAGKTTALRALECALRRSGVPVLGAAPSGRAADELERASGIPSATLHSLLADEHAGAKAILVGDPAQLPAVGAGGLFGLLCERLGALELSENRRQHEAGEREALGCLRAGDAEGYLGHAARQGRLLVTEDALTAKARLLDDWWAAASGGELAETVMLAHRRADVADLNRAARELMATAGCLDDRALMVGGREFRPGDRVVCRRNDPDLGVRNGTRASVREVDPVLAVLTLQVDGGPQRQVHARYAAEHLEHGYALTGHAAQGASIERAFVLLRAQGTLAEWGYVAASRARTETRLYEIGPELDEDLAGPRPDRETTRSLAGALARPAAELPALAQIPEQPAPSPAQLARERLLREIQMRERARVDAQTRLDGLGWLGRRRHGARLHQAIGVDARVLDELRAELSTLPVADARPRPTAPERSSLRQRELARTRSPGRGLGLER